MFFEVKKYFFHHGKSSPCTFSGQNQVGHRGRKLGENRNCQCNQEKGWCVQEYPLLQIRQLHESESIVFCTMYGVEHTQENPFHFKDLPGLFLALFLLAFSLTNRPDFV